MTILRRGIAVLTTLLLLSAVGRTEDYKLENAGSPKGASAELAKALSGKGQQVAGPDGPLCSLWLVKSLAVNASFSPTLSVKYPLVPGSLIGLLQVHDGAEFTDFREQTLAPGMYTLRYAQQPQDGNHIGTSELADFLLVLPAKQDTSPQAIDDMAKLVEISKAAAGSTHPAILSLRPIEDVRPGEPKLVHDSDDDYWILQTSSEGGKPLVLRVVVVGFAIE